MWPVSREFLDALRYGHAIVATMDVYSVNTSGFPVRVLKDVPIISGTVQCSRKNAVRRTLSAEIILEYPNDGYTDLINSTNTRVQVWSGLSFASGDQRVPVGVFRIDSVSQTNRESLSLSGSSLEIYVQENRFVAPYQPTYGQLATAEIAHLIQDSVPNSTVINQTSGDYKVLKRTPWERERWDAIEEMADAIVADVYCAPDGTFVIANQPSVRTAPIQWVVDEGPRGVLVELSRKDDRAGVYNAVVASGTSNDTNVPAVSGVAYDLDPTSPTYWNGGFGKVPKFYASEFLYTVQQCEAVASSQLAESRALNKTLTFSTVPNPALEPGDAIMVAMLDGTYEKHVLQEFTIPLDAGDWSADTSAEAPEDSDEGAAIPMMADVLSRNRVAQLHNDRIPRMTDV